MRVSIGEIHVDVKAGGGIIAGSNPERRTAGILQGNSARRRGSPSIQSVPRQAYCGVGRRIGCVIRDEVTVGSILAGPCSLRRCVQTSVCRRGYGIHHERSGLSDAGVGSG